MLSTDISVKQVILVVSTGNILPQIRVLKKTFFNQKFFCCWLFYFERIKNPYSLKWQFGSGSLWNMLRPKLNKKAYLITENVLPPRNSPGSPRGSPLPGCPLPPVTTSSNTSNSNTAISSVNMANAMRSLADQLQPLHISVTSTTNSGTLSSHRYRYKGVPYRPYRYSDPQHYNYGINENETHTNSLNWLMTNF